MVNGESLFSYKARTEKTTPPASKPHRSKAAVNTQNAAKAKGPKPLTKTEQWLKDNPPNRQGIVDEVKSMLSPRNLTGANAIQAAIKGDGMSTTERITTGLTGVVQGLSFAVGGEAGKPAVEGVKNTGIPSKIESKVNKLNQKINEKTGQTVYVHGSPTSNLKELRPSSPTDQIEPLVWGQRVNPKTPENSASRMIDGREYRPNDFNTVGEVVEYTAGKDIQRGGSGGSLYVTRFDDSSSISKYPELTTRNASTKPVRVDAEITLSGKTPDQIVRELNKQLRRSGANIPKIPKKK